MHYEDRIHEYDSRDLFGVLAGFPAQARKGIEIGNAVNLSSIRDGAIRSLVICGMGGSAIGGDVLRAYAAEKARIPIVVNRDYTLPGFVGEGTLVMIASYSGTTEESLSALDAAQKRGAQCVAITSGGELRQRADRERFPAAVIPGGLAPRTALGYMFFPMLMIAGRLDIIDVRTAELEQLIADLTAKTALCANYHDAENPAVRIAEALRGRLPVVYAAQRGLDAVVTRWRCQIHENAKMLAYGNVFPEMNHNEIVGWEQNPDLLKRVAVVLLRDSHDLPQIRRRMSVTLDLIRPLAGEVIEVYAGESSLLSRIFGLICLGDWVSFYLAVGTGMDPYPIEKINALKQALKNT